MTKRWLGAVFIMLGLSANAYSQPVNYGFETGDTTGWVETFPQDSENIYFGNIDVVTNWTRGNDPYRPVEGNYFAVLETGELSGESAVLSQRISLNRGDKLEGWASFCCGEEVYYPSEPIDSMNYNDYALISIFSSQSPVAAVPWYADSFALGHYVTTPEWERTGEVVDFGPLPWMHWSWTAPAPDSYTLEYKTTQGGDVVGTSYALFDGPRDNATSVPEPSAMVLFGLGIAGVFAAHRFSRINTGSQLA